VIHQALPTLVGKMHTYENNEDSDEDSSDLDQHSLNPWANSDLFIDDDVTETMSSNETEYAAVKDLRCEYR